MNARVGLIHTVPALAGLFESLLAAEGEEAGAATVEAVHIADPWLLRTAMASGVGEDVRDRVARHAAYLAAAGARAILVTCSSIGETVEAAAAATSGVPVLRVDAPMAQEAVELATRSGAQVAVLATLPSTLGPTGRLLEATVARLQVPVEVRADVVEGAAEARRVGDSDRHDALVRDAVERAVGQASVVVLAQASMAAALDSQAGGRAPVLTSPRGGVQALLSAASG